MKEYDSGNPRHVLASALAYEARYRRLSVMRLVSIAAARLTEAVDDRRAGDATEAAAFLRGRSAGSYLAALDVQYRGDATDEQIVDGLRARMVLDDAGARRVTTPVAAEPSASTGAVVGDAKARKPDTIRGGGRVEVRHKVDDDGRPYLDEVIARGADVHLESMSESDWLLILEWADGRRIDVWIGSRSGRAAVDAKVTDDSGGER